MLNKILIGVCVLFGIGFFISYTNWQSNKDRADRMEVNYKEVIKSSYELELRFNELNDIQKKKILDDISPGSIVSDVSLSDKYC